MTARIVLVVSVMFWFLRAAFCAAVAFVSVFIKFQQAFIKTGAFGRVLTWGWSSVSVTGYLAVTEPVVAPQFRTWFGFGGSTVGLWLFLRQSL